MIHFWINDFSFYLKFVGLHFAKGVYVVYNVSKNTFQIGYMLLVDMITYMSIGCYN